ncbi:MAG: ABC transporter ATP-binding protein [Candidatus Omnitrophota bacterium]
MAVRPWSFTDTMLETFNIHKTYNHLTRPLYVLKGIDLVIQEGDTLSIVGPSGAGKSTLLHILGGLDRPTQGQVRLDGEEIYSLNDRRRSKIRNEKVGFVFQFYHLLPELTALENIILPGLVQGGARAKLKSKGQELLGQIGLKDRAHHKPNQLSGGEQQRVAIARALINDPKIIFCDEPTGNLDSQNGRDIMDLLMRLNREHKQTLVIVTHDEHIAALVKRKLRMRDGKILP